MNTLVHRPQSGNEMVLFSEWAGNMWPGVVSENETTCLACVLSKVREYLDADAVCGLSQGTGRHGSAHRSV